MLLFASQWIIMTAFTNITIPLFVEHIFCLGSSDNVFSFFISILLYLSTSLSLFLFFHSVHIHYLYYILIYFFVHLNVAKVPCIRVYIFFKSFIGIQRLKSSLPLHNCLFLFVISPNYFNSIWTVALLLSGLSKPRRSEGALFMNSVYSLFYCSIPSFNNTGSFFISSWIYCCVVCLIILWDVYCRTLYPCQPIDIVVISTFFKCHHSYTLKVLPINIYLTHQ